MDDTCTHNTPAPTLFFPSLLHWLIMGGKHIQKQNEIINELYLHFFFNLLRVFPVNPQYVEYTAQRIQQKKKSGLQRSM